MPEPARWERVIRVLSVLCVALDPEERYFNFGVHIYNFGEVYIPPAGLFTLLDEPGPRDVARSLWRGKLTLREGSGALTFRLVGRDMLGLS